MFGFVYLYVNRANGKVYVGQTTSRRDRENTHQSRSRNGYKHPFYEAVRKYGWSNFDRHYFPVENQEHMDNLERIWIALLSATTKKCGYNLALGGGVIRGWKHSEEWKRNASATRRGEGNGFAGREHSVETRRKLSDALRGNARHLGHRHSAETRVKLSLATRGKNIKSICKNGHERSGANLRIYPCGLRVCLKCRAIYRLRRKQKKEGQNA